MANEKVQKKVKSQRNLVMLLVFLTIIIVGLIIGIFLVKTLKQINLNDEVSDDEVEEVDYLGEIEKTIKSIGEEIEKTNSPEEKATLYLDRAGAVYNLISQTNINKWDLVCSDAYEAEKLKPSANTASMIFNCENGKENEEEANRWLEISRDRAKTEGREGGG